MKLLFGLLFIDDGGCRGSGGGGKVDDDENEVVDSSSSQSILIPYNIAFHLVSVLIAKSNAIFLRQTFYFLNIILFPILLLIQFVEISIKKTIL